MEGTSGGHLNPLPLLKQGYLELLARGLGSIYRGEIVFPGVETPQSPWATCASSRSHSERKSARSEGKSQVSHCPLPLVLSVGTTRNSLAPFPSPILTSGIYFITHW